MSHYLTRRGRRTLILMAVAILVALALWLARS